MAGRVWATLGQMRVSQLILMMVCLAALTGCAPVVRGELRFGNYPFELSENEGIFVIETDSNVSIHQLELEGIGETRLRVIVPTLPRGRVFRFLVLPEGEYRWTRVELPGTRFRSRHYPYVWELDEEADHWRFTVAAGVVNYAGVLILERQTRSWLSMYTANRSSRFVEYLRADASLLLEEFSLVYSGRIRDDFLAYYSSLVEEDRDPDRPRRINESPAP